MTYNEMRDIDSAWRGPMGKWLTNLLRTAKLDAADQACDIIPQNIGEEHERVHLMAKARVMKELIDTIPTEISNQLKELEKQEMQRK